MNKLLHDVGNIERTCSPLNAGTKYTPSELFTDFTTSSISAIFSIKPEIAKSRRMKIHHSFVQFD